MYNSFGKSEHCSNISKVKKVAERVIHGSTVDHDPTHLFFSQLQILDGRPPDPPLEGDHDDGHVVMVVPPRAVRDVQQLVRRNACKGRRNPRGRCHRDSRSRLVWI